MTETWKDVPTTFTVDLCEQHGNYWRLDDSKPPMPEWLVQHLKGHKPEITIHLLHSGYYDPGVRDALPENCYPQEGDNDVTVDHVEIDGVTVPKELAQLIFDEFEDEIRAEEFQPEDHRA